MLNQLCAICEKSNYTVLYKANFNIKSIDEKIFSARRLPDRIHYRIVKCNTCGLVYSTPILPYKVIERLYKKSFTGYGQQIKSLKKTYGYYLKQLDNYKVNKNKLLEIGCGNGFFLEEALNQGYKQVHGVEPGKKSVAKAKPAIKKNIKVDVFKPCLFPKNFLDVICCFQTFDHLVDPNAVLKECYKILKPAGFMLFLNHDIDSLTARLLKKRSPIIDIEHTYLYNKKTMSKLMDKHHFQTILTENALAYHQLAYWLYLFPLPNSLKLFLIKVLAYLGIDKLELKIYPGNLVIIAKKPDEDCPLCQQNNFSTVYLLKNKKILRCKNDGLFLAQETAGDKTTLYNKKYYDINPHPALIKTNRQYFLEKIKTIQQLTKQKKPNILDIGCGWGDFLTVVKETGLDYLGVDESSAAIDICRSKGLNCQKHPSGSFSAITCFQVIEHIKNPLTFLKNCRKLLKKNGLILITTPNNDSPQRKKTGPNWSVYNTDSHFVFYNKKNLADLLIKAGFKKVKVETDEPRYLSFGYLLSRFNELCLGNFFHFLNPIFKYLSFPFPADLKGDLEATGFN